MEERKKREYKTKRGRENKSEEARGDNRLRDGKIFYNHIFCFYLYYISFYTRIEKLKFNQPGTRNINANASSGFLLGFSPVSINILQWFYPVLGS